MACAGKRFLPCRNSRECCFSPRRRLQLGQETGRTPIVDACQPQMIPSWFYGLFFLSGISGLMYEIVWIRMLTRILGSTVYATATALAAFMLGLALGSFLVGRVID